MNRSEHLLVILGEEAAEVAKDAAKTLRFGPNEIWAELGISNAMRVMREYYDLKAMIQMLQAEGVLPKISKVESENWMHAKRAKVEKHLLYSEQCGTLQSHQACAHQWKSKRRGGDPQEASSNERVTYCDLCGEEWDWHGCRTGDCPHETQAECDKELRKS